MTHKVEYAKRHKAYTASTKETDTDRWRTYIVEAVLLLLLGYKPVVNKFTNGGKG